MFGPDDEPDELYAAVTEAIRAPASQDEIHLVANIAKALQPMGTHSDTVCWPPVSTQIDPTKKVQELFVKYVEKLLEGTGLCWIPMSDGTREAVVLFDSAPYLMRHPVDTHPLLTALIQTGCFSRYVTERAGKATTVV